MFAAGDQWNSIDFIGVESFFIQFYLLFGVPMDYPEERRSFPRTKIHLPVQVDTGTYRAWGEMQNITVEGVAFTLVRHLSVGTQVTVEILSEVNAMRSNVLKVKVLRCELQDDELSPSFLISAKLMEANDAYLNDVMTLIFDQPS